MHEPCIRAVLLDLDGVLLDHAAAAREGLVRWLGDRATPEVTRAWFTAQDRHLAAWRDGRSSWQQQRRDRLRDVLPVLGEAIGTDAELDAVFERGFLAELPALVTG